MWVACFKASKYFLPFCSPWTRPCPGWIDSSIIASRLVLELPRGHGSVWCLTGRTEVLEQGVHITMGSVLLRTSNTSHFPELITSRHSTTPGSNWTPPSADMKEYLISQRLRSLNRSCSREASTSLYWNLSPSQIETLRLIWWNAHPYELSYSLPMTARA